MEEGIVVTTSDVHKALRDVVACDEFENACARLDLIPPSQDVDEVEHRASHARHQAILPILDRVAVKVLAAADTWYLTQYLDEDDEPDLAQMAVFRQLAIRCAISSLGQLAEEGDITVRPAPPRVRIINFRRPK